MMDAVAPRPLVEIRDLNVSFVSREATVSAVHGVHPPRRTVISGSIRVGEHDILSLDERAMNEVRGPVVSMIFQEPMTALDPVYRIGDQITETVIRHEGCSRKAA